MKIIKKEPEIHLHGFQLTDQDYKNIMARTFFKLWWIVLLFIGFLLTGGYFLIKQISENTVQQILDKETIQSQFYQYKEKLFLKASQDITDAKNFYIDEIKKYKEMPYSLTDNSIKIFDKNGKVLIIEFGRGKTGDIINFKEHFNIFPYVQVSLSDTKNFSSYIVGERRFLNSNKFINIKELTKEYFKVYYINNDKYIGSNSIKLEFNWLAIGY